ncbi:MAG: VWA domain-containing protein, partial [Candidatus Poribacteria bacterium]
DECDEGDQIAVIDFSSSAILNQPLLEVTKANIAEMKRNIPIVRSDRQLTNVDSALQIALQELLSDRANLEHKPAVILLTDGEIDVVKGTEEQKRLAAQRSEEFLMKETLPKYIQNYVPIYTIAMKNVLDTSFLQTLADKSKLKEQVNEEHFFHVSNRAELVEVFAKIIGQIKRRPRITQKFHFTGQPIQYTKTATPFTKKLDFEVLLDHKAGMNVALKNPEGKTVEPSSRGAQYNLYLINQPTPGKWRVIIDGAGENQVLLTTFADEDIKINLPFPSRFKLGDDIPIFATITYKNNIIESSTIAVELPRFAASRESGHGQNHPFNIGKFLLRIQRPDGLEDGPFTLQKTGGSYTFFYKGADKLGRYTLNFELNGDVVGKDIKILGQKEIILFQSPGLPVVLFQKLNEEYLLNNAIELAFSVTENANLMRSPSISVEVNSPKGNKILSVPRKGLALYTLQYTETDMEGEYTFTAMKTDEYKIVGEDSRFRYSESLRRDSAKRSIQQSASIVAPYVFPWKLIVPIFIIVVAGGLLLVVQLMGWPPWRKYISADSQEEDEIEETGEDIIEAVGTVFSMPNEILFWNDCVTVERISLIMPDVQTEEETMPKATDAFGLPHCYLDSVLGSEIMLNDKSTPADGIMLSDGDVVRYKNFAFKMELKKDTLPKVHVYYLEDLMLRISKGESVRWSVSPVNPRPPAAGATIPLNFIRGDILYIGRDEGIDFATPNDIALQCKNMVSRQISISRSKSLEYFVRALGGETMLNGNLLERGSEIKLNDGDVIKMSAPKGVPPPRAGGRKGPSANGVNRKRKSVSVANRKPKSSVNEVNTFSVILT